MAAKRTFLSGIRPAFYLLAALPDVKLVAFDSPRAGLIKAVQQAITDSDAKRLLDVACDMGSRRSRV